MAGLRTQALGADRILMVFNEAFGTTKDLPFDLGLKRQICYTAREVESARSEVRRTLAKMLGRALRMIFSPSERQ